MLLTRIGARLGIAQRFCENARTFDVDEVDGEVIRWSSDHADHQRGLMILSTIND